MANVCPLFAYRRFSRRYFHYAASVHPHIPLNISYYSRYIHMYSILFAYSSSLFYLFKACFTAIITTTAATYTHKHSICRAVDASSYAASVVVAVPAVVAARPHAACRADIHSSTHVQAPCTRNHKSVFLECYEFRMLCGTLCRCRGHASTSFALALFAIGVWGRRESSLCVFRIYTSMMRVYESCIRVMPLWKNRACRV